MAEIVRETKSLGLSFFLSALFFRFRRRVDSRRHVGILRKGFCVNIIGCEKRQRVFVDYTDDYAKILPFPVFFVGW